MQVVVGSTRLPRGVSFIQVKPRTPLSFLATNGSLSIDGAATKKVCAGGGQQQLHTPAAICQQKAVQWFRTNFIRVGKRGSMTLKDFKKAARETEGFAENLFELFDTDHSGWVSLQELVGGMAKLASRDSHKKIVKWFEQQFALVSGEDLQLQLYEFKKALQIKGFSERFFQLVDLDGSGKITFNELMRSIDKLTCLDRDAKWLSWFEQQFSLVAGSDRQIGLSEFKKALHVKESFFAERFFHLFDKDGNGSISLQELMAGLGVLTSGSDTDKLRFLFEVYDVDGNGCIEPQELRVVLKSCMDESRLKFSDDKLDELTRALFEDADADGSGAISFEELKAELDKHPGVQENLTISAANWLRPPPPSSPKSFSTFLPHYLTLKYMRNNLRVVVTVILFFLINAGLFACNSYLYRDSGTFVSIARGCGMCLDFNSVLMIVLMLRKFLTWLRGTRLAPYLPLDQHIEFHKAVGILIAIYSIGHCLAHFINIGIIVTKPNSTDHYWEYLFTTKKDFGWVNGSAGISGLVLCVILTIMIVCSQPCIRRKGYFEVFYWSHMLFAFWYILLILHAKHFWKWFVVPGLLYACERIMRSKWVKLVQYGRTYIKEGILLPSKVTHLVISRPPGFNFQPGDYIFIQIPEIAKYEWHPFTISSCPEQSDVIWLHIRSVGTWTNRLYKFFEKHNERHKKVSIRLNLPKEPLSRATIGARRGERSAKTVATRRHLSADRRPWTGQSWTSGLSLQSVAVDSPSRQFNDDDDDDETELHPLSPVQQQEKEERRQQGAPPPPPSLVYTNDNDESNVAAAAATATTTNGFLSPPPLHTPYKERCQSAISRGQDFSHMFSPPTIINVDVDPDDDDDGGENSTKRRVEVYMDGPYGTPSGHIFQAEHAVLIGAGIGVTPFASILQSIITRYRQAKQRCPKCNHAFSGDIPSSVMRLKKVDFYWINRDQHSFEWFVSLLSQLEIEQMEQDGTFDRFLEMHMHMTSALKKTDMKAIGLQMALDLIHKKEKRDLITGLKTRTEAGRPDWNKVFETIDRDKRGKVTVFFCGSPALSRTLKSKCDQFGFEFRKENF
ncbi:NADPH oxidase 5-like isoform X2 [Oscarella lobularis]|uniref:NADPH oxidase 5-like isoform X2 n=1 Tax=Oscarella lobularis TaxID=121494 RepID=UPI003313D68C